MESTATNWSKTTRYIAGIGLALFGILILYLSRSVIPLLIVAGLIAVIVRPLILWLYNSVHLSRSLSVILIYLIMAILFPVSLDFSHAYNSGTPENFFRTSIMQRSVKTSSPGSVIL